MGYFKLGINLKTETPSPEQIRKAVEKVLGDNSYKENVEKLAREFALFDPNELVAQYAANLLKPAFTVKYKQSPVLF